MQKFNLTEWALNHQQLVWFAVALVVVMGIFSYFNMGRMEDPDYIIRQMVVSVAWPGASARQVEEQVTDKIEKKLQNTPNLDYLRSYSRPGMAVIFVSLTDLVAKNDVRPTWLEVRNMVNDMKGELPEGVSGPYFNDRFDDVFGSIYAVTGQGFSYEDKRVQAEKIRRILLGVKNVKKVDLIGVQPEKIYIEMENSKLAQLGIDPNYVVHAIRVQNAMTSSGMIATKSDNVYLRVTGMFESLESIRNLPIRIHNSIIRLGDVAIVRRGYADPPPPQFYFNGQPAVGIALSMSPGGNILTLGENLKTTLNQLKKDLPLGLEIHQVSDQPEVVKDSINEFIVALAEAIAIVLLVCFMSLGVRSGIVVALCIPLVILGVFMGMKILGIDLHRISLGALIIALGLLVDDEIIAVEWMNVKLEQGWDRFKAACFAYTSTAFPLLTGTLVTCTGFFPTAFASGSAAEVASSLFYVVGMALIISWLVAATVAPLLGFHILKVKPGNSGGTPGPKHDLYDTKFYRSFKKVLTWCLEHRILVIGLTLACFIGSMGVFALLKQEFFPASVRPELMLDMTLPEGASLQATAKEAKRLEKYLQGDSNIENYSLYIGQGAPRFVFTADPNPTADNCAQFVIVTRGIKSRIALSNKLNKILAEKFPGVRGHLKVIQFGPPDPYPVVLRVSGYDADRVRRIAEQMRTMMSANPNLWNINLDWEQKTKVMRLVIDQDKARLLGIDSQSLSMSLQGQLSGVPFAEFREKDKTISIVFRMAQQNRSDLAKIKDLTIHLPSGKFVPLDQIAKIRYDAEDDLIWRRNLKPTITVQADVRQGITGSEGTIQAYDSLKKLRNRLPSGYQIDIGGAVERSKTASEGLYDAIPAMLAAMMLLLMFQLQSVSKTILTLLTAPLGIIGLSLAMVISGLPFNFTAEIGMLALIGIIIRNSVILIDQIERQLQAGESAWNAIINATVLRFRPILLTAAAAILGMIPLMTSPFWGTMAVAIAGGLLGATILTLFVLPAMYAAWFRVKRDAADGAGFTAAVRES